MAYFFWLSIGLLVATLIYYLVFAGFIYYWHEKKATLLVVPLIFTFDFFIVGFLVICLISLLLSYFPDIVQVITSIKFTI